MLSRSGWQWLWGSVHSMAIDRRQLIAAIAGAVAFRSFGVNAAQAEMFIACRIAGGTGGSASGDIIGDAELAIFDANGQDLFSTRLPARGHDIALRPDGAEAVIFARRPGDWAVVFDLQARVIKHTILASTGRHFYGHGSYSEDGRWLFATENDVTSGNGVLGTYDVHDGYRRVAEHTSGGIGPHDIAVMPDGGRVIANGGVRTHPDTGRTPLNLATMRSNLTVINKTGAISNLELPAALRQNSIRHLAVAADGAVVFGCQWEGDATEAPDLIGVMEPSGAMRMLSMPDDDLFALKNYIGSIALDTTGQIILATAPKGNSLVRFDRHSGRFLGRDSMGDVCGVRAFAGSGHFILSSGKDGLAILDSSNAPKRMASGAAAAQAFIWDNHVRMIS